MSTVCQPGVRLAPSTGSLTGEKPLVDAVNGADVVPLCQVTALVASTGSTSTPSSSPSTGQAGPLVIQNVVQLAMVPGLPGSAGKSSSASITLDEYAPGLISAAQLPGLAFVVSVTSPLESVPTVPSPMTVGVSGQ